MNTKKALTKKLLLTLLILTLILATFTLFVGCDENNNGGDTDKPSTPTTPTEPNTPNEPKPEVEEFTVTFKNYDGEVLKEEQVEKGSNATAPNNVTREADEDYTYTFSGWDKSFNNVQSDLIVTAEFEKTARIYFEVTFMVDNTIYNQKVKVEKDNKVTIPQVPTKEGYIFLGWYTDNNTFLNEFDFDTEITQNITLYANFERDLSNITMQDILTTYKDEVIANLEPVYNEFFNQLTGIIDSNEVAQRKWDLGTPENGKIENVKLILSRSKSSTNSVFTIFNIKLKESVSLDALISGNLAFGSLTQEYTLGYDPTLQGDKDALIDAIAKATITDGFDYNAEDTVKLYIDDGTRTDPDFGITRNFRVLLINSQGYREVTFYTPNGDISRVISYIENGIYKLVVAGCKQGDFSPNQIEVVCE